MRSSRRDLVRAFVIANVGMHPSDIGRMIVEEFGVTRQSATKYLRWFVEEGLLLRSGNTKAREYGLATLSSEALEFNVTPDLAEDVLWFDHVLPWLGEVNKNIEEICQYGFTEMVNNVIEHSKAAKLEVVLERTAAAITISVRDNGVGIFKKIQQECGLRDERDSILELSKGKLTTDEESHTGEGIFFTSRMFDQFDIMSGSLFFGRTFSGSDWLIERGNRTPSPGTSVYMTIGIKSERTTKMVFDDHAPELEDYGFTRTHVPVKLALYGSEDLVSRSQAKRVLARFERFSEIILDFTGVNSIGPSFADEIFRVFHRQHPEISLFALNTTPAIDQMINKAESGS